VAVELDLARLELGRVAVGPGLGVVQVRTSRETLARAIGIPPSVRRTAYFSSTVRGAEGGGMESAITGGERRALEGISRLWWLWLVFGVAWLLVGLVILQFDQASVNTVGVILGFMFLGTATQQLTIAVLAERLKWLYAIFGVLFLGAAVISFISPENTFAAIADILGFLFFIVAVFWLVQAFASREVNELWWIGLISGILMLILAFWTGGQFFITKAYVLLAFAGIWALMHGTTDIVRAFQIRKLGQLV
jgi:uncharacterized membrane protein HdeD (DUF308 family)